MQLKTLVVTAAAVGGAVAQRPTNTSICDYYTTALLKNNTAANQMTLLTLVVNTAVIGNCKSAPSSACGLHSPSPTDTKPNVGISVPGILAPGTFNGVAVNLAPYFTGALASTNTGGLMGASVNFLDGGGAAPLLLNMPANNTSSNQYRLLTHLYEYFGALLQCSQQGTTGYPAYNGGASMYSVHKFMDLSAAEVGYFITQVALSAASFGVAQSDLMGVGVALNSLFGNRCSPATVIIASQGAQLQSICTDSTCPLDTNSTCASYQNATKPVSATGTPAVGTPTATGATTATSSRPATASTAGAAVYGLSGAAVLGGIAALIL
jgi:hypothetical protein